MQNTVPATGNVKMKCICFCCKRVCFSHANEGMVFSHLLGNKKKVAISALFCILKAFPLVIFTLGDICQ